MTAPNVTLSPEILGIVQAALDAGADLNALHTPEGRGIASSRAEHARQRLSLWIRDCQPQDMGQPA